MWRTFSMAFIWENSDLFLVFVSFSVFGRTIVNQNGEAGIWFQTAWMESIRQWKRIVHKRFQCDDVWECWKKERNKNILPRWMTCHGVEALPVMLDSIDPVRRCSCEYLVRRCFRHDSEMVEKDIEKKKNKNCNVNWLPILFQFIKM